MRLRLVLAMLIVGLVMLPGSAGAQDELEAARVAVAEATDELAALLADLDRTQRAGNDLAAHFWQSQGRVDVAEREVAESQRRSAELAGERESLIDEVRVVALDRYMDRTDRFAFNDIGSAADQAAAEALARLMVGGDTSALDRLAAIEAAEVAARAELAERLAEEQQGLEELAEARVQLDRELARLTVLRAGIGDRLTELEHSLAELEQAEARRQALAEEAARLAEERRRAAEVAAAAAQVPTPAPTVEAPPTPTVAPTATSTVVPNPQPSEPLPTSTVVPNPQPSEPLPTSTAVPNPQPSEPFPTPTPVPATPTAVPNPQPSEPLPTPTAVPTATPPPTAVPNPPRAGGIVCPLAGAFSHIDDFNAPRAVGGVHRANDLIAATGTPVLAVADGTVDHRSSSVGGLSAHLKGDNGDYYFYTHLSGYENVGAGWVAAGTVIGYVGETGNAPIPHLHFEIHRGGYGNYANPYGPVRDACF